MYLWIHLKIFFVCEEVFNHKEKGQVCTQSTLNSGDCILILHVLSFLECGLQIKKIFLWFFFLFFLQEFCGFWEMTRPSHFYCCLDKSFSQ